MVTAELFTTLRKEVARLKPVYDLGYVTEINANALVVAGLSKVARQGAPSKTGPWPCGKARTPLPMAAALRR